MRLQGRISEWNDERGFGFVTQNGTNERYFLHISHMASRRVRPSVGELLTFEAGRDDRGRLQARDARRVDDRKPRAPDSSGALALAGAIAALVVVVAAAYVGWVRFSSPHSTIAASAHKILFARDALEPHPEFQCSPEKNSCSKMASCAEALFHLEHCAVPNMDGDGDGIPCERQWCN